MHNERHEEAILRVVPRRQRMPRIAWRRIRSAHRPVRPFSFYSNACVIQISALLITNLFDLSRSL